MIISYQPLENVFVFVLFFCLRFPEAEARLALQNKLNESLPVELHWFLSAQRIFNAGLHLFLILTSQILHETISSLSLSSHMWGTLG